MDVAGEGDVVALVDLKDVGRTWTVEGSLHVWLMSLLHCYSVSTVCGGMVVGGVSGWMNRWRARTGR